MAKNPHAVALGRLGGRAGGRAGGVARAAALSPVRRKEIARAAARARWQSAEVIWPLAVARLLKSYDSSQLRWKDPKDRWVIVSEVLVRGDEEARQWLARVATHAQMQELARTFRGAGLNEQDRATIRAALDLSDHDIPQLPFLGFTWRA